MRQAAVLFFTALLLVNLFGFYTFFMVQQQRIREEVFENQQANTEAANQVFKFTFTQFSALHWTLAGKEFSLNGRLYDVVKLKQTGNQYELTASSDAGETELVSNFLSLFSQQQSDQDSQPLKNFISHFQQDYVGISLAALMPALYYRASGFFEKQMQIISCTAFSRRTPPPQFFHA
jgi:hypothetical protein